MNELKNLSATELAQRLKNLVAGERKITTEILWHLREVERRRLHLEWAYPSLFEYCLKGLGYSASAAYRRLSAMRLLKDIPEVAESLESGKLNLSQTAAAQEYFKKVQNTGNALSTEEKKEVLDSLAGKSTRECEQIIAGLNPELITVKEKERVITEDLTEIKIVVTKKLMDKITRVKQLKSHVNPNPSYADLLEMLLDAELRRKEASPRTKTGNAPIRPAPEVTPPTAAPTIVPSNSRFIPAQLKRAIHSRDKSKCTYQDSASGQQCGSKHQIQIDHIVPIAHGGLTTAGNLRLLCAKHNRHEARKKLGDKMMSKYCD